jgi:hypothetical protein
LIASLLVAAASAAGALDGFAQSSATLYHTVEPGARRIDWSRTFFSFRKGEAGGDELGDGQDLAFGNLKINNEDWFQLMNGGDQRGRSVMRDLGAHTWAEEIAVPALEPLPELKPGEQRLIKVDASADTHGKWAKSTTMFAKVEVGHVYAVRVVRDGVDLYALFRVEAHEQNESCAITWRIVPAPAEAADGRVR